MLESLELIRGITDKPISIQPNAGMPRQVEGRMLYMSTPEYMAEYAKRFFEKGVRIIGGCCGTTPDHLREIVKAVRPLHKAMAVHHPPSVAATHLAIQPIGRQAKPLAEKSRLGQKLAAGQGHIAPRQWQLTMPLAIRQFLVLSGQEVCFATLIPSRASCCFSNCGYKYICVSLV